MTGTIDLSVEQFRTIAERVRASEDDCAPIVRLIIHPVTSDCAKTIRVDTRSLSGGDVLEGYFFVLRDGTRLTGNEYAEHLTALQAR